MPIDHPLSRAWLALEGLSVGDAFGERFFGPPESASHRIEQRWEPKPPWPWTDDTEMAVSIVEELTERGAIDQTSLARRFATRMTYGRGYGEGAYALLTQLREGADWSIATRSLFRGMGSFGNGGAMRAAPIGAYFADDLPRCIAEAHAAAEVTHAHPEGIAGGIAIAVAALHAIRAREASTPLATGLFDVVRGATPAGYLRDAIDEARALPAGTSIADAARKLGNGAGVTAPDTVPLCLWLLVHRAPAYDESLWATVSALGDRDTTCAIVGGVAACFYGVEAIPAEWRSAREPLPIERGG
jgi:ADP-ribosylglycohydrolase